MRARRPSRHLDFHRLMDLLRQPGCPLCRAACDTSERWLRALFHEQVNDIPTRQRLRRGGAFCHKHTAQALQIGDALGSSIIYADLLRHALDVFPSAWAPRCPLCDREAETVRDMLHVLWDHLPEEDVRALYRASDGLCLPHLAQALERARGADADWLCTVEREKMETLLAECEGFVSKSDYLQRRALAQGERNAWRRAARKLGGGHGDPEA